VTLRFAEIYQGTPADSDTDADQTGQRVFDVTTEGQTVLDDYDVYAEAGDSLTAVDETYAVEVTDGTLNIGFNATGPDAADNAKISAIEVTKVDAGNTAPTIEPIQNQTVTEGESTAVDVNTSDADGDSVSLSLSGAPSFASLSDDDGGGHGTRRLAPGTGEVMLAEADCTRVGESVATVEVVVTDGSGTRLATARGTYKMGGDSADSAWSEGTPSVREDSDGE
jgi:uncharacterized ParB-like nuclease family protein